MIPRTKLRQVIEQTLSFLPENKEKKDIIRKTCQRTFQALRIDVNHEFEVLYEFMEKLPGALKPGGRVAILTFHSGEDKLVKKALKSRISRGSLFRICQRCSPAFGRRVCTEWACKIYEDALGCEGGVKVSVG